ncbi:hypothetical protein Misp06_03620 [Microbulbifer sp. NBRC 101763]|uniref:glycosyltransferase family 4 protein n=1 Tax=Microbulbifer sp. NBRC 101763 TaxID=1113820 RepID=UPI00309DEDC6
MIVLCTHVSPSDEGGVASSARFLLSKVPKDRSAIWVQVPVDKGDSYKIFPCVNQTTSVAFDKESELIDHLKVIDVVIVHFVTFASDFGLNLKRAKPHSKLVLNFRGNDATLNVFKKEMRLEECIKSSELLVYVSSHLRNVIEARYDSAVGKGIVVNNSPKESCAELIWPRQERLRERTKLKFGAIGFWKWKKGFSVLLEFLKNNPQYAKSFTIYGEIDEREPCLLSMYKSVEYELEITPLIPLAKNEVSNALNDIDVLVIPSLAEGVPNVLLEGYSSGCFIIGSDIPGISEIVARAKHGITFKPGDSADLGRAIRVLESQQTLLSSYLCDLSYVRESLYVDPWREISQAIS